MAIPVTGAGVVSVSVTLPVVRATISLTRLPTAPVGVVSSSTVNSMSAVAPMASRVLSRTGASLSVRTVISNVWGVLSIIPSLTFMEIVRLLVGLSEVFW